MKPMNQSGIIQWFARNSVAANLLMIGVIVMGLLSIESLRKESFPSLEPSRITIATTYNSGDPKQAEEGISMKIEDAIQGLPGIKRITSNSTGTGSTITVEKESDYSLDTLMKDIQTKMDSVNGLPSDAKNPVITKATREEDVITVQLYGNADQKTLQDTADNIRTDLLLKNGIRIVNVTGEKSPYINIDVDELKLKQFDLSMSDIESAINAESSVANSASIRNSSASINLKVSEQAYTAEEFKNIVVKTSDSGVQVFVKDLASVYEDYDKSTFSITRYNGYPSIALKVVMDDTGDVMTISEQAKEVVSEWNQSGKIPEALTLMSWDDKSESIADRLSLLASNALTGIALVFIILAVFLNVRVAFWVAAGLPFIFAGTMMVMDMFTVLTINQMTTFGFIMALGIVVDDAVVVGESVYTERKLYGDSIENTMRGTLKVAVPTIFGVLTTIATFYALSNISGGMGQIFAQFGTVVTICLVLSMVESKLILPAHLAHLNTKDADKPNLWNKIQGFADKGLKLFSDKVYLPFMKIAIRYRYSTILSFALLLYLIALMPMNGIVKVSFFPDINQDRVRASIEMEDGAGYGYLSNALSQFEETAYKLDKMLQGENPKSGIDSLLISATSDTSGNASVEFSDDANYSAQDFSLQWANLNKNLLGAKKTSFQARMEMADNFNLEIKAIDSAVIEEAGKKILGKIKSIDGVTSTESSLSPKQPQFKIDVNNYGRVLGLSSSDLAMQVLNTFGGGSVQKMQKGRFEVTVSLQYPEKKRQSLSDVKNAMVTLGDGIRVPLYEVATINQQYSSKSITRIDGLRASTITASVNKDVLTSEELVNIVKNNILPDIQTEYPSMKFKFAGEAEQKAETMSSMSTMTIGAFIAIFALLAIPLKSYVQPLVIMTAIPFGVAGAILGHWANGLSISLLSMFGILALSGVVVNDSLLLVSRYNELKNKGVDHYEAIIESATSRMRAVLLTSLTTFFGLIPILHESSDQAQFLKPAAASLGYGILFATVITLILIPCLIAILPTDTKKPQ